MTKHLSSTLLHVHTDCSLFVVRSIWVIISLEISFYWRDEVQPPLHDLSCWQKKGGGLLQGDCVEVKLWNLTFINILSPLDLIQSFSLGRSCPNLSALGSPFSNPMKSGAAGERPCNHRADDPSSRVDHTYMCCWHKCDLLPSLYRDSDRPLHFWVN